MVGFSGHFSWRSTRRYRKAVNQSQAVALLAGMLMVPPVIAADPALYYGAPRCGASNQVVVAFKSGSGYAQLDTATTNNVSNYSVSGRTVTSAVFSNSSNSTVLTLNSALSNLNQYTVNVANILDQNGAAISASADNFYYSSTEVGLVGEYHNNKTFSGTPSVSLSATIDETFTGGIFCIILPFLCGTDVSARWEGFLLPAETGNFVFETETNDGSRLWVDDFTTSIINQWGPDSSNTVTRSSSAQALTQDVYYPIRQDFYYDRQGFIFYDSGSIDLRWDPPSQSKRTIPSSALSTCVAVDDTPVLDYFVISVPAAASACGEVSVTITAMGSDGNVLTDYTGTIDLSLSSNAGDWSISSGTGSLNNGNADDGDASYTFAGTDNGVVILSLSHPHAGSATVGVNASAESVNNDSSAIQFLNAGITISDATAYNWDVIAGRDHGLTVEYALLDETNNVCSVADYTGLVGLKFWLTPTGVVSSSAAVPSLVSGAVSSVVSLSQSSPTTVLVNILNGTGNLTLRTTDVGDFDLYVLDNVSGFVTDLLGLPVALPVGTQNKGSAITVRPFGLLLSAAGNQWQNQYIASGLNAQNGEGPVYQKAGDPFSLSVSGVLYDAGDDSNDNGIADEFEDSDPGTMPDLSDNGLTPSFGSEGISLNITAQLIAPASGNPGILSGSLGSFSGGSSSGLFSYSEVGIVDLTAQSAATYLNSGTTLLGSSGYVGRFIPHHFDVVANSIGLTDGWLDIDGDGSNDWDCDFTYFGQNFALDDAPQLTFTAYNRNNVVTQNYAGVFNKFSAVSGVFVDQALPNTSTSALVVPGSPSISVADDAVAGQFIQTITGYSNTPYALSYSKPLQPGADEVPFDASLDLIFPDNSGGTLVDSDGVCYQIDSDSDGITDSCQPYTISAIGGTRVLYGRLNIDNNFGPEINELILPLRSEYWKLDSGMYGFYVNGSDSIAATKTGACTGTSGLNVGLQYDPVKKGNLEGNTSASLDSLVDGLGRVIFTAPGVGNQGQVNVNLLGPDFLQFDFNGDGVVEAAGATATFGIYGGKGTPVIYKRESYR